MSAEESPYKRQLRIAVISGLFTLAAGVIAGVLPSILDTSSGQRPLEPENPESSWPSELAAVDEQTRRADRHSGGSKRTNDQDNLRKEDTGSAAEKIASLPASAKVMVRHNGSENREPSTTPEVHTLTEGSFLEIRKYGIALGVEFKRIHQTDIATLTIVDSEGRISLKPILGTGQSYEVTAREQPIIVSILTIEWQRREINLRISRKES